MPGGLCQPLTPNHHPLCWLCHCCASRLQQTGTCPLPVPQKPDPLVLSPQCTNPLPGLTKLEDCCGSVGLFWGADQCLACPPRPGECCCRRGQREVWPAPLASKNDQAASHGRGGVVQSHRSPAVWLSFAQGPWGWAACPGRHTRLCPLCCCPKECSGLGAGPRLSAFSPNHPCETLVQPVVWAMPAPLGGRNRKRVSVVLGGAVLDWRRRLQARPYRVTGLLWAQHGLGRGSGNNTTSNNWQERTRGPFQGHGRPALFLLRSGVRRADPVGDGDSLAASLGVLCDRHGPLRHSPPPTLQWRGCAEGLLAGGRQPRGQPVLTRSTAGQGAHVQCNTGRELLTSPLPARLPPFITAWLLVHMPSLDQRTKVNRPHGPGDFDP